MTQDINERIDGIYKHYKNRYYDVYCSAFDINDNKYVLYKQCYGDKDFWIRPYDMFFELIKVEGTPQKRFEKIKTEQETNKILQLIEMFKTQNICIRHSETGEHYVISKIDESKKCVTIQQISQSNASGYLTEYEIARRLGFISCVINGEVKYFKSNNSISDIKALSIGENNIDELKHLFNPCSIDLKIAETGFLKTRFKLVDPQSVEYISCTSDLWKKAKTYSSKNRNSSFFKLRPGATIITHTKDRIHIPYDCAGKIEIKSTFARLSLSITYGDFCNPGYDGHFPLEIKNNGCHTVIIHESETMAQLILIPLQGPILSEYSSKATFKNAKEYDDGTPYSFWRERSIQSIRKKTGTQPIIDFSN